MNNLQTQSIARTKQLKEQFGGTIFSFPLEEDNPFSPYAIVMCVEDQYFPYPDACDISEAASGIFILLEEMKKSGMDADYQRNVRMISYQAQIDAPSTVMRKLKNKNISKPFFNGDDYKAATEEEEDKISARGLLKISYIEMVEEGNPKASQFMDKYYQLLATRKYGKTAAAIKQEVRKMSKDQVVGWLEQTYEKYVHDGMEIMSFLDILK
ncbi:MAG: hypothetical protein NHB14_01435 [Desulfosporosinus sp.]|nr:hypothetical protein [Desulfosporosinus sp.]